MAGCLSVPAPEAFAAVTKQFVIVVKMMNEVLRRRLIIFAPVIFVVAADLGALFVNGTAEIWAKMLAFAMEQEVPASLFLVDFHAFMGDLPKQVQEVLF